MSKKVLIISASPRKGGNSDTLCDEFMRGSVEAGHTVKKVRLSEHKIGYCTGCGVCNQTHHCILKDDMENLLDTMLAADAIVLATPVYFYAMNGQLKTFIDRCVPKYTEMKDKDFYFIITAADTDKAIMEKVIESLRGFTRDCLPDAHEKGIIYGLGVWQSGDVKRSPALTEAYEMGKKV